MILGAIRSKHVTPARYEAAYRMVHELGMSLPATGRRLNRDHTTILHAISRHVAANPELKPKLAAAKAEEAEVRKSFDEQIVALYFDEQKTPTHIARELNISRHVVNAVVRREVVRIRKERQAGQSL